MLANKDIIANARATSGMPDKNVLPNEVIDRMIEEAWSRIRSEYGVYEKTVTSVTLPEGVNYVPLEEGDTVAPPVFMNGYHCEPISGYPVRPSEEIFKTNSGSFFTAATINDGLDLCFPVSIKQGDNSILVTIQDSFCRDERPYRQVIYEDTSESGFAVSYDMFSKVAVITYSSGFIGEDITLSYVSQTPGYWGPFYQIRRFGIVFPLTFGKNRNVTFSVVNGEAIPEMFSIPEASFITAYVISSIFKYQNMFEEAQMWNQEAERAYSIIVGIRSNMRENYIKSWFSP